MDQVKGWLPVVARVLVVASVAKPAADKFFDYPGQVAFFSSLGIPQPEIMVIVSGVTEVVAMVLLVLGAAGRLAALMLLGIMVVVLSTAGLTLASAIVLIGSLVIFVLGTGPYSLWQPAIVPFRGRHA